MPETVEETVFLVTALTELDQFSNAMSTLENATDLDAATRQALRDQVAAKKAMRGR
jgi:hypothetical protein